MIELINEFIYKMKVWFQGNEYMLDKWSSKWAKKTRPIRVGLGPYLRFLIKSTATELTVNANSQRGRGADSAPNISHLLAATKVKLLAS